MSETTKIPSSSTARTKKKKKRIITAIEYKEFQKPKAAKMLRIISLGCVALLLAVSTTKTTKTVSYYSSILSTMTTTNFSSLESYSNSINNNDKKNSSINATTTIGSSLSSIEEESSLVFSSISEASNQIDKNNTKKDNNEINPWYGWQVPTLPSSLLNFSWRDCFSSDRDEEFASHCPNCCRDSVEEWGQAPPPPTTIAAAAISQKKNSKGDDNDIWIPDVTMLKRMYLDGYDSNGNPWPPPLDDELCEPIGPKGGYDDDLNRQLFQAVPIHATSFPTTDLKQQRQQSPKLLCMIYTIEKSHPTMIRAIRETWAPGCDGFLAFSTQTDPRIPAISIPHDGPESYRNMWQKVRSIWKFVYQHYLDDFDFFHLGGDDMYILPQNLKNYLSSVLVQQQQQQQQGEQQQSLPENIPLYIGRRFQTVGKDSIVYNTGGPGYVLSRLTLQQFASVMDDHPKCQPKKRAAEEDVLIARCLFHALNITTIDTRDDQQRERFHHFPPGTMYGKKPKSWYIQFNKGWGIKTGKDCCAPDSIAFHYIKRPAMMRHIHKLLYQNDTCQNH